MSDRAGNEARRAQQGFELAMLRARAAKRNAGRPGRDMQKVAALADVRRYLMGYLRHSALNAGQAARDIRYIHDYPRAANLPDSVKKRLKSLGNNLFYTAAPPTELKLGPLTLMKGHHPQAEIDAMKGSAVDWFKSGYNPWKYADPNTGKVRPTKVKVANPKFRLGVLAHELGHARGLLGDGVRGSRKYQDFQRAMKSDDARMPKIVSDSVAMGLANMGHTRSARAVSLAKHLPLLFEEGAANVSAAKHLLKKKKYTDVPIALMGYPSYLAPVAVQQAGISLMAPKKLKGVGQKASYLLNNADKILDRRGRKHLAKAMRTGLADRHIARRLAGGVMTSYAGNVLGRHLSNLAYKPLVTKGLNSGFVKKHTTGLSSGEVKEVIQKAMAKKKAVPEFVEGNRMGSFRRGVAGDDGKVTGAEIILRKIADG